MNSGRSCRAAKLLPQGAGAGFAGFAVKKVACWQKLSPIPVCIPAMPASSPTIHHVVAISAGSSKLAAGCRRASAGAWYIAESGYAGDDELGGVEDVLSTLNRLARTSHTACAVKGVIQSELRPGAENQVGRGWIGCCSTRLAVGERKPNRFTGPPVAPLPSLPVRSPALEKLCAANMLDLRDYSLADWRSCVAWIRGVGFGGIQCRQAGCEWISEN